VGDSGLVALSIDTLNNRHALEYNNIFTKGGTLQFQFKVLKSFKTEKDVMSDYQNEVAEENKRETKSVEDYMTKKGFKGEKTKSGAYFVVENAGDQTMKADSGMIAMLKYKGYLQSNGTVFDTNMDSSKGHPDAYPVYVGSRTVIPAWEEALPHFGKGGSGKVFVPAFLGYGPQGNPPAIPPNSNLVFDIQVVDVKVAPPQPKNQNRPGMETQPEQPE
jgi:FKBP-type peptidyl-prolyl cis-trans isomerase